MLYTANTTVEAYAEWVSALYSHLALKPPLTITWVKRTFATSNWPYRRVSVTRTRDELAPFAKSKRAWMTAGAPIYKSHKKWSYWSVESAPTRDYAVSRGWPHMTRVTMTHVSIPGYSKGITSFSTNLGYNAHGFVAYTCIKQKGVVYHFNVKLNIHIFF